jgi:hypothetical protein
VDKSGMGMSVKIELQLEGSLAVTSKIFMCLTSSEIDKNEPFQQNEVKNIY